MMLPSVKINVPLLWGLCVVVFSVESVTASTTETSMNISVKPNSTTWQMTTAHVATEKKEKGFFSNSTDGSVTTMDGLVTVKIKATEATSISKLLSPTVETTVKDEVQHSPNTTVPDSLRHITEQSHQPPVTSFTEITVPAKASATTVVDPLLQSTSTTHPETASELTSITSVDASTHIDLIQRLSSNTTSKAEGTASPTSEAALVQDATETKTTISSASSYSTQSISATSVHDVTSQFPEPTGSSPTSAVIHDPVETVASTSAEHSSTSQSASTTSTLNSTSHILDLSRSRSTSSDSLNSTATVGTSPAGILISQAPTNLTVLTVQPTPAITTTPSETLKTSPSSPVKTCNTRATVKQCLIAIASLAALATIFMVSTIVLCAKLSTRKYKFRKPQQETEMMCISALLPDRNPTYMRQRNPITNGVMVYPLGGDSDEEVGDNLTLSSFLPENV